MSTQVIDAPKGPGARDAVVGPDEAAGELCLERRDMELAMQLGEVRTAARQGGRRMVPRSQIARLRAEEGFPSALRGRLRLVGTVSGAELLGISSVRFTKLAKCGCFTPVRWYANRYRSVVWLYLASEVRSFGETHTAWLSGRLPPRLLAALADGEDLRARGWRSRSTAWAAAQAADGWQEASVWAALLGEEALAQVVPDERERARLRQLRPELLPGRAGPPFLREVADALLLADGREEREFARLSLGFALDRARPGTVRTEHGVALLPNGDKPRATVPVTVGSV
ncbi:DUF6397 family protein [Streptomyces sp. RB6PN25]|uniref:DUF6397 family protein n=1 Tax=Streptomyces humicola TaxID=2953240 RepID=A0ABT1Q059_9ACTN|nr:DUF6397 family protein [Streptomyces humicola]MCQ4083309.1 DUF6397 family protein [Streptomyces humicola]